MLSKPPFPIGYQFHLREKQRGHLESDSTGYRPLVQRISYSQVFNELIYHIYSSERLNQSFRKDSLHAWSYCDKEGNLL